MPRNNKKSQAQGKRARRKPTQRSQLYKQKKSQPRGLARLRQLKDSPRLRGEPSYTSFKGAVSTPPAEATMARFIVAFPLAPSSVGLAWQVLLSRLPRRVQRPSSVFRVMAVMPTLTKAGVVVMQYRTQGGRSQQSYTLRNSTVTLVATDNKDFLVDASSKGQLFFLIEVLHTPGHLVNEYSAQERDLPIVLAFHRMRAAQEGGAISVITPSRVIEFVSHQQLTIRKAQQLVAQRPVIEERKDEDEDAGLVDLTLVQAMSSVRPETRVRPVSRAVLSVRRVVNESGENVFVHRIYTQSREKMSLSFKLEDKDLNLSELVALEGLRIRFV